MDSNAHHWHSLSRKTTPVSSNPWVLQASFFIRRPFHPPRVLGRNKPFWMLAKNWTDPGRVDVWVLIYSLPDRSFESWRGGGARTFNVFTLNISNGLTVASGVYKMADFKQGFFKQPIHDHLSWKKVLRVVEFWYSSILYSFNKIMYSR